MEKALEGLLKMGKFFLSSVLPRLKSMLKNAPKRLCPGNQNAIRCSALKKWNIPYIAGFLAMAAVLAVSVPAQDQLSAVQKSGYAADSFLTVFPLPDEGCLNNASQNVGAVHAKQNSASSWDAIREQLTESAKRRDSSITLTLPGDVTASPDYKEELSAAIYSVGVSEYYWAFKNQRVEITRIQYYDDFEICATPEEALAFIESCAKANKPSFRIYFSYDLANALFDREHLELEALLAQTRLKRPSDYSYGEKNCRVIFFNASYWRPDEEAGGRASTMADFVRLFNAHTETMQTEFEIMITDELQKELFGNSSVSDQYSLFAELRENCGIISLDSYTIGHFLGVNNIQYYPGRIILQAYNSGKTDALSSRERQTLNAALEIAGAASGTELERERKIHDLLCDRIVYYTDEISHDENDCAIGALLNGKADCDGYADAFYLCGNLAGLKVKYQHGDSLLPANSDGENDGNQVEQDGSHMWNLIHILGKWIMVDVTWDDNEIGCSYVYYNQGRNQAGVTHIWDERAVTVDLLPASDNSFRNKDLEQIEVRNWKEVYNLLMASSAIRKERICLSYPASLDLRTSRERLDNNIRSVGIKDYYWDLSSECAEIYQIEYYDHFSICNTKQEIIDYINSRASAAGSDFWVYLSPDFSLQMFANDMRGLKAAFAKTRLLTPFTFSYNEEYRRIQFSNPGFYSPKATLAEYTVRTLDDVSSALAAHAKEKPDRILFDSWGIDLQQNHEAFSVALYSSGIESFSWTFSGSFALITDITYYDHFKICSTSEEAVAYMKYCKNKKLSSIRIYCASDEFYSFLHDNQSEEFFDLMEEAGCKNRSISYSDWTRLLLIEDPVWK